MVVVHGGGGGGGIITRDNSENIPHTNKLECRLILQKGGGGENGSHRPCIS